MADNNPQSNFNSNFSPCSITVTPGTCSPFMSYNLPPATTQAFFNSAQFVSSFTRTNPMYKSKYSTLDNVINTVKPVLSEFGLSYIQSPSTSDDGLHIGTTTLLMHESGEWIESDPVVLPAYKLGKDGVKIYDAQAAGIAITYGRRYSLSSLLGVSSEDDDDANGIIHETNSKPTKLQTASEKQLNLITKLLGDVANSKNISKDEAYGTLKQRMKKDMEWFTPADASKAIEILNNALKQGA